jgi:ribosomal protein L21E
MEQFRKGDTVIITADYSIQPHFGWGDAHNGDIGTVCLVEPVPEFIARSTGLLSYHVIVSVYVDSTYSMVWSAASTELQHYIPNKFEDDDIVQAVIKKSLREGSAPWSSR